MRFGRIVLLIVLLPVCLAACSGGGGNDTGALSTEDSPNPVPTIPPTPVTVSITSPLSSGPISGELQLNAEIRSDASIARVVFTVDDEVIAQLDAAPFAANWNSASVNDGEHLLRITATDASGMVGTGEATIRTSNAAVRKIAINLTPFGAKNPNAGAVLSRSELFDKLAPWRHRASCVRTFGVSGGLELVPEIAAALHIDCVVVTIWLGSDAAANDREIARGIALVKARPQIKHVLVGSEVLFRRDLDVDELLAYIAEVQAELPNTIVTTSETLAVWLDHPTLVNAVPELFVTLYPFYGRVPLDLAMATLDMQYRNLQAHARGKPVVIAESGWPSCGSVSGTAIPSQATASYALSLATYSETNAVRIFFFASADESFKALMHGEAFEGCWGLAREDGSFKQGLEDLFAGRMAADTWSDVKPAPTLLAPVGNVETVSPVFRWRSSGAARYRFHVLDSANVATNVVLGAQDIGCGAGESECRYTLTTKLAPNEARWRVQSLSAADSGFWSDEAEIFVVPCTYVGALSCPPILISPGAEDETDATPTLAFIRRSAADLPNPEEQFQILVTDVNGVTVLVGGLTHAALGCTNDRLCEYTTATLTQGDACWQVGSYTHATGQGPWSTCKGFKVVECGAGARPCAPVPRGPIGAIAVEKPTFAFSPVVTATRYTISLQDETLNFLTRRGNTFSSVELGCADGVSMCELRPEHQLMGGRWTVQAINAAGQAGGISNAAEFSNPGCRATAGCHRLMVRSSSGVNFELDGVSFFYREGGGGGGRGVCVAEVSPAGNVVTAAGREPRCFDTWGLGMTALADLSARLDRIDEGSYTAIVFGDDAGAARTEQGYQMLEAWGATMVRGLDLRDPYALITRHRTALAEDYIISPSTLFAHVAIFEDIGR